jgi:hypothetical protein
LQVSGKWLVLPTQLAATQIVPADALDQFELLAVELQTWQGLLGFAAPLAKHCPAIRQKPALIEVPQILPAQKSLVQERPSLQALKQAPQCETVEDKLTSQPLLGLLSQFPKLPVHEMEQDPPEHWGTAFCAPGQTVPQLLQFCGSVSLEISQPSVCLLPLQSRKPESQAPLQTPLVQAAVMW